MAALWHRYTVAQTWFTSNPCGYLCLSQRQELCLPYSFSGLNAKLILCALLEIENRTELTSEISLSLKFQSEIICFLKEMMPLDRKLYPNKVDTVGIQSNVILCLRR